MNRLTGYEALTPELIAALMRGDYGDQTSMFAGMAADPWVDARYGNPGNLSPEVLAQVAAGTSPDYFVGSGGWSAPDNSGNTEAQLIPSYVIGQKLTDPNWGTARWNTWDLGGNYLGYGSADSDLRRLAKAVAVAAGAYYGAGAMSGAEGGAGAGAGAEAGAGSAGASSGAAGASSITLPTTAEVAAGMAPASVGTAAATMPAINVAGAAGAAGAGAAGAAGGSGSTGTSALTKAGTSAATSAATQAATGGGGDGDMRAQERAGYETNGSMPSSPASTDGNMDAWDWVKNFLVGNTGSSGAVGDAISGYLKSGNYGGLLGAIGGYLDSKDKQETQSREPWKPMQPYLLGLAEDGGNLYRQYREQPFSPAQQTAYGNLGNVLDVINGNAGGLLSGFQAAGSGRNNFTRGKPSLLTGYGFEPTDEQWRPGLLGNFGTTPIPRGAK